jgi:hypothetical protein
MITHFVLETTTTTTKLSSPKQVGVRYFVPETFGEIFFEDLYGSKLGIYVIYLCFADSSPV